MVSKLDNFGRIVIPKRVRKKLGINSQTRLNIIESDQKIIIEPLKEEDIITNENGVLVFNGKIDRDVNSLLIHDREDRLDQLKK